MWNGAQHRNSVALSQPTRELKMASSLASKVLCENRLEDIKEGFNHSNQKGSPLIGVRCVRPSIKPAIYLSWGGSGLDLAWVWPTSVMSCAKAGQVQTQSYTVDYLLLSGLGHGRLQCCLQSSKSAWHRLFSNRNLIWKVHKYPYLVMRMKEKCFGSTFHQSTSRHVLEQWQRTWYFKSMITLGKLPVQQCLKQHLAWPLASTQQKYDF